MYLQKKIQVCFSPALLSFFDVDNNTVILIIDVLRATTSICTAFQNNVKEIIPVATLEEAKEYKLKGFIVAAERDGIKADFADFGNSPFNFMNDDIKDQTLVYSTTNGTQVINLVKNVTSDIVIGSFINLTAVCNFLLNKNKDVLIICAGWKGKFNLEDTICAGAVAQNLINSSKFQTNCDSTIAAIDLWNLAKNNLINYIEKCAHRHRLKKFNLDDIIPYAFTIDLTNVLPIIENDRIISIKLSND